MWRSQIDMLDVVRQRAARVRRQRRLMTATPAALGLVAVAALLVTGAQPDETVEVATGAEASTTTTAPPAPPAPSAPAPECMGQDLVVSAGADKVSYRSGEPVVITVEYRNNSEATCVLPSGTSVEWRDASGQPLGGVSGHGDCLGRCAPAAPGDAAAQTWCWDQRANGVLVPPGSYLAAVFTGGLGGPGEEDLLMSFTVTSEAFADETAASSQCPVI